MMAHRVTGKALLGCYRRWRLLLLFVVGATLTGCSWGARSVPWDRLEAAARSFPAPDGFSPQEPQQRGRYCGWFEFTCENPVMGITFAPSAPGTTPPVDDVCRLLERSVDAWVVRGLREAEFQADLGCTYFGRIRGFKVSAFVSDDFGPPVIAVSAFG
jgi:hypothetical protein